ncbi:hypothetical protein [Methylotenera sp.]|jgi:hypothetical protein|uniref:hypothetical protein n=1 Tax=Methylotenera sp. TaxID=2051956 RepID=UPI00271B5BD5|nr:hypothetical protein [Methylotenera sp.]MDO9204369.1 hypothetical protein [Methylotenera sp.]MDP1523341.1 hypothetical protein [Methylotenera sp.]MDP1658352.1 hypothetical protein [Methylotenera sp.]MDP3308848.1 hypothetical protein [Methylotenera sp.]MDP3819484.1 hypothetical protein [Methylotenera sp.]
MNKSRINTLITTAFIASLALTTTSSLAGRDFFQEQLIQNLQVTKQKLEKAKAAKGLEQQKLMGEHMQMLHDNMATCREMKPRVGMTEKERDEWFVEHQKIMDNMMSQMMEEHKINVVAVPCDKDKK